MRNAFKILAGLALAAFASPYDAPAWAASNTVAHDVATVNGFKVDRFTWSDSKGYTRTVSIKQEGNGNSGHGGYAVQMTYQVSFGGVVKTVSVDPAEAGEGFGYFVSHERYRTFTDGDYDTIAHKIFKVDDSPLGRGIAASTRVLNVSDPTEASIQILTKYHHYGTVSPIPKITSGNNAGDDVSPTPVDKSKLANYILPVTISWTFQSGKDYPVIRTAVDMHQIGPDLVNFDLRGPYGAMIFDRGANGEIDTTMWGDRYHFINLDKPITRNSTWTWNKPNTGARYSALIAGPYEMGLFEPRPYSKSALADGYSNGRGLTSASVAADKTNFPKGRECPDQKQILPCDYEWPYQSVQYSLPENSPTSTTNFPKMAWGSSPYYGTGPSLPQVYDTGNTSEQFNGRPDIIAYYTCVVLGRTTKQGLTFLAARNRTTYNCADPS